MTRMHIINIREFNEYGNEGDLGNITKFRGFI